MKIAFIKTILMVLTIAGIPAASMAAITAVSDDFSSDTTASWISVGATTAALNYDGTSAGDYDDGDATAKLAYTAGMTLTGDGVKDDGGLRMDSQNTTAGDEAIGLTLAGTMEENESITFTGSVYNDNTSYSPYNAQLWNLTDDTLLAESGNTGVEALSHVAYKPVDFSVSYSAKASDEGDTLQIRFIESTTSTARDIFIDNFAVTSAPETLFAYEGFDSAAATGTDLTAVGVTGSGFSSYTNTHGYMDLEDGLTYADSNGNTLITTGKSGGLDAVVGGTRPLQLVLNSPITSGTVYFSCLVNESTVGTAWGYEFGLDDAIGTSSVAIDPEAGLAADSGSTWRLEAGTKTLDTANAISAGTDFVVGEVNMDTGEVTVWINPTDLTDVSETAATTLNSTSTDGALNDILSFGYSLSSDWAGTLDEVRIGNTMNIVVPLVDTSVQTLTWNFSGDPDPLAENIAQYDYTSDQVYVGSSAVADTLAFNGGSGITDYWIEDKGAGHENCLFFRTINAHASDVGIYLQKMDFRVNDMNLTNKTRVSWSFDILGSDHAGISPSDWTVRINYGNYSENINVSDSWFTNSTSAEVQTFDFVDDDSTWTTVTGSYEIAVNQAGSAGSIQIRQPLGVGAYTSGDGIYLDNIQVTIASIEPVYDTALEAWAAGFGVYGTDAEAAADPDGDFLSNLDEYAIGGDPSSSTNNGYTATYEWAASAGTNWLYFVHAKRSDAAEAGLSYTVQTDKDLVDAPDWSTSGVEVLGTAIDGFGAGYDAVTNRVSTDSEPQQFIRLKIEEL